MESHSNRGEAAKREPTRALDAIRSLVQHLRLSARDSERTVNLSGAQHFVLQQLSLSPVQSLNELAARTHTHQSSVSVVVQRLTEQGLVASKPSALDRRRRELALTPAGARRLAAAPPPSQLGLISALERLKAEQRHQLQAGLDALLTELGAPPSPPPMFFEEQRPRASSTRRPRGTK